MSVCVFLCVSVYVCVSLCVSLCVRVVFLLAVPVCAVPICVSTTSLKASAPRLQVGVGDFSPGYLVEEEAVSQTVGM